MIWADLRLPPSSGMADAGFFLSFGDLSALVVGGTSLFGLIFSIRRADIRRGEQNERLSDLSRRVEKLERVADVMTPLHATQQLEQRIVSQLDRLGDTLQDSFKTLTARIDDIFRVTRARHGD
jgi:hypothetical protein